MSQILFPAPPSSPEILKEAAAALRACDPRKVNYLDAGGSPAEGPATLRDRISHALLHDLNQAGGQAAGSAAMADTDGLQKSLFAEMRGRIKEDDSSVPQKQ